MTVKPFQHNDPQQPTIEQLNLKPHWYAMRDLSRHHARHKCYEALFQMRDTLRVFNANPLAAPHLVEDIVSRYGIIEEIDVYTPMKRRDPVTISGEADTQTPKWTEFEAYDYTLLFIRSTYGTLRAIIEQTPNLQGRYAKGNRHNVPIIVPEVQMDNFIRAVSVNANLQYYTPNSYGTLRLGSMIRIIGGPLAGRTGRLATVRGSRKKRLMVEIPNMLSAAIEVQPEYVQVIG